MGLENKQNVIEMLNRHMHSNGIETQHASADADVLISETAVESAISHPTRRQSQKYGTLIKRKAFLDKTCAKSFQSFTQ